MKGDSTAKRGSQVNLKILESIADTIETRPVLGHWPHMRAGADADYLRGVAAEIAVANEGWLAADKLKLEAQNKVSALEAELAEAREMIRSYGGNGAAAIMELVAVRREKRELAAELAEANTLVQSLQNKWASRPLSNPDMVRYIAELEAALRYWMPSKPGPDWTEHDINRWTHEYQLGFGGLPQTETSVCQYCGKELPDGCRTEFQGESACEGYSHPALETKGDASG